MKSITSILKVVWLVAFFTHYLPLSKTLLPFLLLVIPTLNFLELSLLPFLSTFFLVFDGNFHYQCLLKVLELEKSQVFMDILLEAHDRLHGHPSLSLAQLLGFEIWLHYIMPTNQNSTLYVYT